MRHQATGCVESLGQALADTWWARNLCQLPQLNYVYRGRQKLNQSPALLSSWQYLYGSRAFGTGTILLSSISTVYRGRAHCGLRKRIKLSTYSWIFSSSSLLNAFLLLLRQKLHEEGLGWQQWLVLGCGSSKARAVDRKVTSGWFFSWLSRESMSEGKIF